MLNGAIPYNSQMLASVTRHQVGTVDARTRDRIIKTSIVLQMPEENLRKKKAAAEQQSFLQMILQQQGT